MLDREGELNAAQKIGVHYWPRPEQCAVTRVVVGADPMRHCHGHATGYLILFINYGRWVRGTTV